MSQKDELIERFMYHPPDDFHKGKHEEARGIIIHAATKMVEILPECREKALVLTKLEEAMFWANAAIARTKGTWGGGE